MFIPNNNHIDIAKQKSTDLQEEAKKVRLLNQVRPSLKIRVAQQLHKLAHMGNTLLGKKKNAVNLQKLHDIRQLMSEIGGIFGVFQSQPTEFLEAAVSE